MRIDKTALYKALSILNKVINKPTSTVQALQHFKLEATSGVIKMTGTNLEQTLAIEMKGEGELTVCLPAQTLTKLVKPESKKDDGIVSIEVLDENTVIVKVDGLTTRLATLPVEEFPQIEEPEWNLTALWPSKPLIESLAFVVSVASNDETRPFLCGVSFEKDCLAATDGHRLHCCPAPGPVAEPLLLPVSSAKILQRILKTGEHIVIAKHENRLKMKVGNWTLETKLIDAEFPPVDQVIPARHPTRLSVDNKTFAKALKRIGAFSRSRTQGVKMTINGVITLESSSPEMGDASIEVQPIENNHEGEDFIAGYNLSYLLDAIGKGKETATISIDGPLDPLRVDHGDERVAVVMPMRA